MKDGSEDLYGKKMSAGTVQTLTISFGRTSKGHARISPVLFREDLHRGER